MFESVMLKLLKNGPTVQRGRCNIMLRVCVTASITVALDKVDGITKEADYLNVLLHRFKLIAR